jgi:predicted DNA-binding transcriptional regulator AlpA
MEHLLTPSEVAQYLGMSVAQLAQLRYTGKGPTYLALSPRKIRYTEAALRAWLASRAQTSTAQPVA